MSSQSTVATEIIAGHGKSLGQAARLFPSYRRSKDKPEKPASVSPSTIFRWIAFGVRLPDGTRLRLEAVRLSGRWLTSVQAIERFMFRQTPQFADATPSPAPRIIRQQQRAQEREAGELSKIGI